MTFEELSATQGIPANDTFSNGAMAAPTFDQPTPDSVDEPMDEPTEVAAPPE